MSNKKYKYNPDRPELPFFEEQRDLAFFQEQLLLALKIPVQFISFDFTVSKNGYPMKKDDNEEKTNTDEKST